MSGLVVVVLVFFVLAAGLGGFAYFTYRSKLRRAKAIERGLKMVPILIHLPPPSSDTQGSNRDIREVMREKTAQAEVLYNLIVGTATEGFKSKFYGQRHVALELIAIDGVVHFFAAVPVGLVSVMEKAIQTAYPGARLEQVEDHNIFNQEGRLAATLGGEMVLKTDSAYPIATYALLERDPMEALLTTISALEKKDGVAIQIMLRPADPNWVKHSVQIANGKRKGRGQDLKFSALDIAKAAVKSPDQRREEEKARLGGPDVSNLQLSEIESIEEKTKHSGFEVLIRVIVSTQSVARSQQLLRDISTAFALFEKPGLNGFKFLPALDVQGLVTAFIFRFFPTELKSNILNSVELATLFHLPDSQFTPSTSVERQKSKEVDGPIQLSPVGLLFGYNDFRGVKKEIRLSPEDRRRHTYILGQTGTGKSTMLENLAVQDMIAGNGFAFIDPHGDSAEKLLAMVPRERAEDVIYFNPADTEYPLGLNLFEFKDPTQKDFIVQETINMLYKLYDPGHTGIIGPRYEHWYRNAALTLMSDPNGSTFIEIPKVFTDTEYLKQKFKYLKDPTVIDFWTKEMGQTSDYHKSEMLGWFVSKFGAFQNNEMMRNIIGQTKSSFNLRDVMDNKKILIVNLSKGRLGELNSQLLGMIFVIKFQAAAMSRADTMEDQRADFSLYVDEFQNFSTDSFASILSEARKYRLNLVVANQFIGQLSNEIRDAVFGNIGTIAAHRMGPDDAEFMVKQFAPVFDASDLMNIPNYNAAMRLMIGGLPSQPFSIRDLAPLSTPNLELGLAIKQLSAAKFGHAKAEVEASIIDRFSSQPVPDLPPSNVAPLTGVPALPEAPVTPLGGATAMVAATQPAPTYAPLPQPAMPAPQYAPMPAVNTLAPYTIAPNPSVASVAPAIGQLNSSVPQPIGSPQSFNPVPVAAAIVTPPPIGAPPVVLNPQVQPFGTPIQPFSPVPPIIAEPNVNAQADRIILEGGFSQAGPPQASLAPAISAVPAPIAPPLAPIVGMATLPPPIGAPPVELSVASAPLLAPQPTPVSTILSPQDPSTLSLSDITGGRVPVQSPDDNLSSVPIMEPGTEPSVAAVSVMEDEDKEPIRPFVGSAVAPTIPLGSGMPLEDDPYANIEVLGDFTSPVQAAPGGEAAWQNVADASRAVEPVGQPLPTDPYANIDLIGSAPGNENTANVTAPISSPVATPTPTPVTEQSLSIGTLNPTALESVPTPSAAETFAAQTGAQYEAVQTEESSDNHPDLIIEPPQADNQPVLLPTTEPAVPIATSLAPTTASVVIAAPVPVETVAPVTQSVVERTFVDPIPKAEPSTLPQSQSHQEVVVPKPSVVVPPAPAEVYSPFSKDESLIHFVDPAAQSILDSPDMPATFESDSGEPSLSGLPDGVRILNSEQPSATMTIAAPQPIIVAPPQPVVAPVPAQTMTAPLPVPVAPAPVPAGPLQIATMPSPVSSPVEVQQVDSQQPNQVFAAAAPPVAVQPSPAVVIALTSPPVMPAQTSVAPIVPPIAEVQAPPFLPAVPTPEVQSLPILNVALSPIAHVPTPLPVTPTEVQAPSVLPVTPSLIAQAPTSLPIATLTPKVETLPSLPVAPTAPIPQAPMSPEKLHEPPANSQTVKPTEDVKLSEHETRTLPVGSQSIATSSSNPSGKAVLEEQHHGPIAGSPIVEVKPEKSQSDAVTISLAPSIPIVPVIKQHTMQVAPPAAPQLQQQAIAAMPESNASLVDALKNGSLGHTDNTVPAETSPDSDAVSHLESVAEMLEEAPEVTASVKPITLVEPKMDEARKPGTNEHAPEISKSEIKPFSSESVVPAIVHEDKTPIKQPTTEEMSPDAQIEKAEHEIDDLLSTSLIHEDSPAAHRRLPEPVASSNDEEGERGVDLEVGSAREPRHIEAPVGTPQHMAEHHGLKIIQPLEPIVPPKEQFARELAALSGMEQQPTVAPAVAASVVEPLKQVFAPVVASKVSVPVVAPLKESQEIVKRTEEMLPSAPQPVLEGVIRGDGDSLLPEPQLLAATDVAKLRAERDAQAALPIKAPPVAAAKVEPREVVINPAPVIPQPIPNPEDDERADSKRRRKRHGNQKREQQAPNADISKATTNSKPVESDVPQSGVPGKLILPTTKKPEVEPAQPVSEKPKKLAPGEVYVDQNGNVMIGE
jgi:hypothetical protein